MFCRLVLNADSMRLFSRSDNNPPKSFGCRDSLNPVCKWLDDLCAYLGIDGVSNR